MPEPGPARRLGIANLINTVGNGIFLTGGVVFLTRSVGLSPARVGLALTIGGLLALLAGPVGGDASDRFGTRSVAICGLLIEAAGSVLLVLTHDFVLLVIAVTLGRVGAQSGRTARATMTAIIAGPQGGVRLRAQMRSLSNLGISVGALLAGLGLVVDTRAAYVAMILFDVATFLIAAATIAGLPRFGATREHRDHLRRWVAVVDGSYLTVAALNAVMCLNYGMLTVGVPLWITTRTSAPRPTVAALLLINTVAVVALQVPASRSMSSPAAGALGLRRAGWAFAVGWTLFGLAAGLPVALAVALLVVGVALHSVGELWQAAASFELSFSLARTRAMGQYQGVFGVGPSLGDALAPIVAAGVCVAGGLAGWAGLGLGLAATGAAAPTAVRWATRRRALAGE